MRDHLVDDGAAARAHLVGPELPHAERPLPVLLRSRRRADADLHQPPAPAEQLVGVIGPGREAVSARPAARAADRCARRGERSPRARVAWRASAATTGQATEWSPPSMKMRNPGSRAQQPIDDALGDRQRRHRPVGVGRRRRRRAPRASARAARRSACRRESSCGTTNTSPTSTIPARAARAGKSGDRRSSAARTASRPERRAAHQPRAAVGRDPQDRHPRPCRPTPARRATCV